MNNNIVFIPSGRLGNAFFRYMACALINIKNPSLSYCLQDDFTEPIEKVIFYPGLDHEGDDIRKSNNIFQDNEQNAVCYNTLGYYKHMIDIDNLKSNMFINKENGHGLFVKTTITLNENNFLKFIEKKLEYFNIKMDGFFQYGHFYLHYKREILNYIEQHKLEHYIQTDLGEKILMRDLLDDMRLSPEKQYNIAIHIRLGDFKGRPDYIEEEYYFALFNKIDFKEKKICLLFDPSIKTGDCVFIENCLAWFKERQLSINIESNSLLIDFNIMKQAKTLICSMSTLSWSAAYLSKHIQTCYMPDYNFYKEADRSAFYFKKPIENTILYPVKTTQLTLSSIKPYILTLPQYSARLEKLNHLRCRLSSIGLETTAYNGVNGRDITLQNTTVDHLKFVHYNGETYTYNACIRTNQTAMTKGEFGCAWSHINLLKQLLTEPANINYYLILEDDVELVKPLSDLSELLQNIPEDTDMCHLAKSDWYPFIKTVEVNSYFSKCIKAFFNRTTAYLISKKGAVKVLAYCNNHIDIPIDDIYCTMYRTIPDFRFYVPSDNFLFKEQDNNDSTICDINKS
jgi:GR25 family glycosyltransferase involved in LPS biosynthesis